MMMRCIILGVIMRYQNNLGRQENFASTLDFIDRMNAAPDELAVVDELAMVAGRYGLTHMLGGIVPLHRISAQELSRAILLMRWPQEWARRYIDREYAFVDPVMRRLASMPQCLRWRDCFNSVPRSAATDRIVGEASECGLVDGIAVPFVTLEGRIAAISFGGRNVELGPEGLHVLPLVTSFALGRILRLRAAGSRAAEFGLTPRERECLAWVAQGKTQWEISVILMVSESTIEKHLLHARTKLGAATRAQAIAEAARMRLIG